MSRQHHHELALDKSPERAVKRRNRVRLCREHETVWKDVARFATNQDAATEISAMVGCAVQVQTIRRRFGPSGRGNSAAPSAKPGSYSSGASPGHQLRH
jgi:hypothetical protein